MTDKTTTDFKQVIDGIKVAPPEPHAVRKADAGDGRLNNPQTFRAGQSGNPAGRKPGTKIAKTVKQIADEMNFNPIEAAIMLIREDTRIKKKYKIRDPIDTKLKADLIKYVGDKMFASLKAVDYTVFDGEKESAPKTIQLYLPEKGSIERLEKESRRKNTDVVHLELTPELGVDICNPCEPIDD